VVVEQVGDECEVEFGVAGDERLRGEEFAARWVEAVGVLEDLLGALVEVGRLKRRSRADVRCELVEEDCVVLAVLDVVGEVLDSVALSVWNSSSADIGTHLLCHPAFFR
jgi:hypothetical protein